MISLLEDLSREGIKFDEFEVLIYDQGSVDGIEELIAFYKDAPIKLHKLKDKSTFSAKNNIGAKDAKGEYVIFLNNDMEILSDLVLPMKEILDTHPNVGIVGNKHYFPNMRLNHVGMAYIDKNVPHHLYPNAKDDKVIFNEGRVVPAVTAACIMVRRDEFLKIGGFDEKYIYGYEDVDLCLKYKKELDKDCYFEPRSRLIHFGQSSYGRNDDDEANRKYFEKKWKDANFVSLFDIYNEDAKRFDNIFDKVKNRIIGRPLPSEQHEAEIRTKYNRDYDKYRYDANTLVFFFDEKFSAFNKVIVALYTAFARNYSEKFKIIVDTPANFPNYRYSDAITVMYGHFWSEFYQADRVQSERDFRFYAVNYENHGDRLDYWTKHIVESKYQIIAISEYCKDFLAKAGVSEERLNVLHHGIKDEALQIVKEKGLRDFDGTAKYLIVTNSNDPERYNTDMAIRAFAEAFSSKKYKVELTVKDYGGNSTIFRKMIEKELHGFSVNLISEFLSDYDLEMLYYNHDCMISPFRGEGFGMKLIDAMAVGEIMIAPNYGGPKDFLSMGSFLPLKYDLESLGDTMDKRTLLLDDKYMDCMVDEKDLVKQLDRSLNEINDLKEKANQKVKDIQDKFSWDQIAHQLNTILSDVPVDIEMNQFAEYYIEPELVINPEIKPEVSILLNSYNRPDSVAVFLNHIQTLKDLDDIPTELVLVDDGSDKPYTEIIKSNFKSKKLKIRYIRYEKNRGYAFPKNVALAMGEGKVGILLGDDIHPLNGFIKRRFSRHVDDPKLMVLGHTEWHPDVRNNLIADFAVKQSDFQFGYEVFRNEKLIEPYTLYTSNISFNLEAIQGGRLFMDDIGVRMMEDAAWGLKLAAFGFYLEYDRKIEALHLHPVDYGWFSRRAQKIGEWLAGLYTIYPETQAFTSAPALLDEVRHVFVQNQNFPNEVPDEMIAEIEDRYSKEVAGLIELFEKSKGYHFKMQVREKLRVLLHKINKHYLMKGIFIEYGILDQCKAFFLENEYSGDIIDPKDKLLNRLQQLRIRRIIKLGGIVTYGTLRDLFERRTKNVKGVLLENIRRVKDQL